MPAITVQNLSKTYTDTPTQTQVRALDGVSLTVEQGEFFGLLGPNGAGKSTLIHILSGLAQATSGSIQVHGFDVQHDYMQARRYLGIVPQELAFDPFLTVRETLRFQSGYFGIYNNHVWIDELLVGLGLEDKADANMRQLSGGMKRRVLVGLALVHKPPVIVLDEPTAGVDVELRQTLWQFVADLNQQGHTVLLTTHYLEEAEALCERIAMLKQGKIRALEKTSALLAGASANVLHFKTNQTLPSNLAKLARVTGRMVQLPADDTAQVEAHLSALRQAQVHIEDLEIRKADLEDVFMALMHDADTTAATS